MIQPAFNKLDQMTELVHLKLAGGDISKDSPFDRREVKLHIENALNNKLRIDLFENYSESKEIQGHYLATFTSIPVQYDATRQLSYLDLPARYVSLPRNRGLFSIGAEGNQANSYIPTMAGSLNFSTTRQTPFLEGQVGYYPEGSKAIFTSDISNAGANSINTEVQLVIAADGDTFDVFVPANIEAEVIEYVYQTMANKSPEDKVNDNNETV